MIAAILLALAPARAAECPEGWMDRGCPPGVDKQDGCCPTRAFCEEELQIERRKAARRHLGDEYDRAVAVYDEAWAEVAEVAALCIEGLDLPMCSPAHRDLDGYLRRSRFFQLRVRGGNDTVQTSCGEERVFFDGDLVSFDAPHFDEAATLREAVIDMEKAIVRPGDAIDPGLQVRPAGAPPAKGRNPPAGVPGGATVRGVRYGMFYTTTEQPGPILDALRLHIGKLQACYLGAHPGSRMLPEELSVTWHTEGGRVARIAFPHDGVGDPELRQCIEDELANVPMSRIADGRSAVVLKVTGR